ncbi:MAG: aldo/keto reductase [Polyangiaceae bacterium]
MATSLTRRVCGVDTPVLFYGTAWKEERSEALTSMALQNGFRAIDSANQRKHYFEAAVGRAVRRWLAEPGHHRRELFLQSKFTHRAGQDERLPYDPKAPIALQVEQSLDSSLEHFGSDYLDSLVLHGPTTRVGLADEDWEAWRAMERACQKGKTRLIGVSNVTSKQLELLYRDALVKPAFVQNRCYASTGWDDEVRAFATAHGMGYQGFSLLTANPREVQSKVVQEIAVRHGVSPEVIVLRFALSLGIFVLTGTTNSGHQRDVLACVELDMAPEELDVLSRLFTRSR